MGPKNTHSLYIGFQSIYCDMDRRGSDNWWYFFGCVKQLMALADIEVKPLMPLEWIPLSPLETYRVKPLMQLLFLLLQVTTTNGIIYFTYKLANGYCRKENKRACPRSYLDKRMKHMHNGKILLIALCKEVIRKNGKW